MTYVNNNRTRTATGDLLAVARSLGCDVYRPSVEHCNEHVNADAAAHGERIARAAQRDGFGDWPIAIARQGRR